MGGLNTSLMIGLQALQTTQGAISATSNNISNANTTGYTREVAQFTENPLNQVGNSVLGGGVTLTGLQSVRDELLNLQIQNQTSLQSSQDQQYSSLEQIQNYFMTTGGDIGSALSAFTSSLTELSASPSSSAARQGVISSGQNLARSFNTTSDGLTSAQSDADTQVTQTVAEVNSLITKIAQLNGQVQQLTASGKDGGTTQDQRDALVQQLSKFTGITVMQGSDGETITTGNGTPLVMGDKSYSLQTTTGSDGMQHVLDYTGNDITTSIQGGQLGGAIAIRDTIVPDYLAQLNTLASEFSSSFNAAQAAGFDLKGAAGTDFFSVTATRSAAHMSVVITDPSKIAASSDGSTGSNGNVANLTAVLTKALPSGESPAQAYASLLAQVGTAASDTKTQSTAIGQNLLQLTNQQGSVSGVSIDEETTNLIRFQTAYQAAARIVSTIQRLNSDTINMIS
jgi:flagellar hook-associated protein 1